MRNPADIKSDQIWWMGGFLLNWFSGVIVRLGFLRKCTDGPRRRFRRLSRVRSSRLFVIRILRHWGNSLYQEIGLKWLTGFSLLFKNISPRPSTLFHPYHFLFLNGNFSFILMSENMHAHSIGYDSVKWDGTEDGVSWRRCLSGRKFYWNPYLRSATKSWPEMVMAKTGS